MFYDLIHSYQVKRSIGEWQLLPDGYDEYLLVHSPLRDLDRSKGRPLANAIRLHSKSSQASPPATRHKTANPTANIQNLGIRRKSAGLRYVRKNVQPILAQKIVDNLFVPLGKLDSRPILPAIFQQKVADFRIARLCYGTHF
jgi:hypothetical protein